APSPAEPMPVTTRPAASDQVSAPPASQRSDRYGAPPGRYRRPPPRRRPHPGPRPGRWRLPPHPHPDIPPTPGPREDSDDRAGADDWCAIPVPMRPAAPDPGKETAWGTPAKTPLYPQRLGACANVTAPAREQRVYCRKPPATRQPATRQLAASGTTLAADTAAACPGRSITDISPAGAG